jgi:hypothetical protein
MAVQRFSQAPETVRYAAHTLTAMMFFLKFDSSNANFY